MFFADLLEDDSEREKHKKVCSAFSAFLKDCLACLVEAYKAAEESVGKSPEAYYTTIFLLTRHVIEYVDGVAILISQGGSQPCLPLLRSALEATMGVMYILKEDTKCRALAYQVAHTHKRLKLYAQIDPSTKEGQRLREFIGDDADKLFGNVTVDCHVKMYHQSQKLSGMLAKPDYALIEQEWQEAIKKKKEPAWYSLFRGPQNARELAKYVGWALMYDFAYQNWSNEVHAGSAMEAAGSMDGEPVMRPIRHPEQLQPSLVHAMNFTLQLSLSLMQTCAPDKLADLKRNYVDKVHQRRTELLGKPILIAPWKSPGS